MPLSTTTTTGKSPVTSARVGSAGSGFAANIRGRMVRMSGIGDDRTHADDARERFDILHVPAFGFIREARRRISPVAERDVALACTRPSRSATSFGWSRSAPKLNSPTRVMKPFLPRGLSAKHVAASRPLRR